MSMSVSYTTEELVKILKYTTAKRAYPLNTKGYALLNPIATDHL